MTQAKSNISRTHKTSVTDAAPVLLRAEGLKKSFGGQIVLDGIDLELRQGEFVLLCGENGSGKTTLLNILTGNLEPDNGTISYLIDDTPRSYRFPRRWWQELNPFDHFTPEFVAREGVGRTWQDVRLFGSMSLRNNIAIAAPNHLGEKLHYALFSTASVKKNEAEICAEADKLLFRLGLADRAESSADMVSLGQSKRIAIARAVTAGAKALFLDEPLAGLDRQGISDVLALLESLKNDYNVTIVVIEHVFNLTYLHNIATTDWLLSSGKISRIDRNNGNGWSHTPDLECPVNRPAWIQQFVDADDTVVDEKLLNCAHITRIKPHDISEKTEPVLSIEELVVRRGNRVLQWVSPDGGQGLNLSIQRGEVVFLHAPNGWGKTTLLECIAGLLPVSSGAIRLNGDKLNGMKSWERAKAGIKVVMATRNVFLNMSGSEMLRLAGATGSDCNSEDLLKNSVSKYSGGQRQQLALNASQGKGDVQIYIYDEPFSMLDSKALEHYRTLFRPNKKHAILVTIPSTTTLHEEIPS